MDGKCVGCGFCCSKAPCAIGHAYGAGVETPCKFLAYKWGRHWCLLITSGEVLKPSLHIGAGCSCTLFNAWRKHPIVNRVEGKEAEMDCNEGEREGIADSNLSDAG